MVQALTGASPTVVSFLGTANTGISRCLPSVEAFVASFSNSQMLIFTKHAGI